MKKSAEIFKAINLIEKYGLDIEQIKKVFLKGEKTIAENKRCVCDVQTGTDTDYGHRCVCDDSHMANCGKCVFNNIKIIKNEKDNIRCRVVANIDFNNEDFLNQSICNELWKAIELIGRMENGK